MQNLNKLLHRAAPLAFVLAASVVGCSGTATLESSKDASEANPLDDNEKALLAAIVAYRGQHGAGPLTDCATLNVASSLHADDMRDHGYLSDIGKLDNSSVNSRACSAGYQAGCTTMYAMGELVSSGISDPDALIVQWSTDPKTLAILVDPHLLVIGVGQSFGAAPPVWSVDLGGAMESSCNN